MGGRGCGAHTRYVEGDRRRGSSYSSLGNSEVRDKGSNSISTSNTQEDITLDFE